MREFLILGMTFIILVHVPGWATATQITFDQALLSYNEGKLNVCAWAFTRAHKVVGNTWQDQHWTPEATCTTNGVDMAQNNPSDAISTHPAPKDQVHASADAKCDSPTCPSFTVHTSATVVSKPHSVAAGAYVRGGIRGHLEFREGKIGVLKGPTVTISGLVADLSSGTDPHESVFALAITDQAVNEWNAELATLLAITDPPSLPVNMCMALPKDSAGANTHCDDPKNLQKIEFRSPHKTYFKLVVTLDMNGQLSVKTEGEGTITPEITKQDFAVKSVPCAILFSQTSSEMQQQCFFARLNDKVTREIKLMPMPSPPKPREYPPQFAIDVVNGIVDRSPFGKDNRKED